MDDTEGVQFPGTRSIPEPTVLALPGPGATMGASCDPDRKKKPPKTGKKSSKKGSKKKK